LVFVAVDPIASSSSSAAAAASVTADTEHQSASGVSEAPAVSEDFTEACNE